MVSAQDRTIVIVEDEPDTAEMLAEMLRLNGYRVLKSYGGNPAIELIAQKKPDAVVLDVMMPDLDGLEVLRIMKRDSQLANIPVIVVSAKILPTDVKEGLDAGASIYLTKPVAYRDFREAVSNVLKMGEA